MTMTSISGSASRMRSARMTCGTACEPCTAVLMTLNRTCGQRVWALTSTSRSAADARPVISPTPVGRNGSGRLRCGAKRPSAASSFFRRSIRASSSPMPTARIWSARRLSVPRPKKNDGLACTTTLAPSRSGGSISRISQFGQVTDIETSADGSRSVRNAVCVFGRELTCVTWPSTQTLPSRWIQSPILRATVRTGHGLSAVLVSVSVTGRSLGRLPRPARPCGRWRSGGTASR